MKKGLIALIGIVLIGFLSTASAEDIIYSQDFNSHWSATSPPSGWTITDSYNGPQSWDASDWNRYSYWYYRPPGGSGYYAIIRWYGYGIWNTQTDILQSPPINCSGWTGIRLRIDDLWDRYGGSYHPYIEGSKDGGATWIRIYEYHGDERHNDHIFPLLWAGGESDVRIRFRGYGRPWDMNWWSIDNFILEGRFIPAVAIMRIEGLPSGSGINCCYTPALWVMNTGTSVVSNVDFLLRTEGGYESHGVIPSIDPGDSAKFVFDQWCAPPDTGLVVDTFFAGMGGSYVDTLPGTIYVSVDMGGHTPVTPLPSDTLAVGDTFGTIVTANVVQGCQVPFTAYIFLRDSTGKIIWTDEQPGAVADGPTDIVFERTVIETPGYYLFTFVAQNLQDPDARNDTLQWEIRAKMIGTLDVGTETILMPSTANPGDSIAPKALVKNYGTVRAPGFDVECTIEPGGYKETKSIPGLEVGAVDTLEFPVWVAQDAGEYTATVTTKLSGDAEPDNDSKTHKINVAGIAEESVLTKFALSCIRPNPFSEKTVISYQLPVATKVSLAVYDITGKLVKSLVNETKETGSYTAIWNAKDVSAGIYFVKLIAPAYKATRKVILTR